MILRYLFPFSLLLFAALCHAQTPDATPAAAPAPAPSSVATENKAPAAAASTLPAPLRAAQDLFRGGKFAEAESAYNSILQTDPKSAPAYVALSRMYLKQERLEAADRAAAKANELAGSSDEVRVALGELRFRQGRINDAQDLFVPIVRANTKEARAYFGLGRVYWALSYYQHAKLMFDKAYERDPDDPDIRRRWLFTLTPKERLAALKGYLSGDTDDDADEREHLETSLVAMEEAESQGRKGCRLTSTVNESHQSLAQLMYGE